MWFFGVALGAALMYFLDPDRGTRRRHIFMDKLGKWLRNSAGETGKMIDYTGGKLQGVLNTNPPDNPNPDDKTLKERIQSEIFKNPETSRQNMNVNVADGVVELRGELPTPQAIDDLIARVKAIPNVKEIHDYLHLPNTPAPNKQSVIQVS